MHTQEGYKTFLKSMDSKTREYFKSVEDTLPFPKGVSTRVETVNYTAAFPGSDIHGTECSVEIAVYVPEVGIDGERLGMMYIHGGGMAVSVTSLGTHYNVCFSTGWVS